MDNYTFFAFALSIVYYWVKQISVIYMYFCLIIFCVPHFIQFYHIVLFITEAFAMSKLHKDIAQVMVKCAQDDDVSDQQTIKVKLLSNSLIQHTFKELYNFGGELISCASQKCHN